MSAVRFAPTPGTIADLLRRRLLALDYSDFARCVCLLLEVVGYEDAVLAGRHAWKGYNHPGGGGYDLEAVLPGGLIPRRVIAQIKQYDSLQVHQRSVDELRGASLRTRAAEALLITTSAFSKVVRGSEIAGSLAGLPDIAGPLGAPIRLIDGKELLGLLIRHRLGVRERNRGGVLHLEIDEDFFGNLTPRGNMDTFRTKTVGTISSHNLTAERGSAPPRWSVTVRILSSHRPNIQCSEQTPGDHRQDNQTQSNEQSEGGY